MLTGLAVARAGRVEHVCAGFRVCPETADRLAERLGMAGQVAFRARGEQHAGGGGIDRGPRGPDPLDRQRQFVERARGVAGRVFDGEAGDARFHALADVFENAFGRVRVAGGEVGVDRHVHGGGDLRNVGQHGAQRYGIGADGQAARERETGTGGGQRRKSKMTQISRRADVPGIGDHETAALVQLAEGRAG
jgi:hypothetical protein